MQGLLIDVDFASGRRAGGIDPRSRRFPTSPAWQSVDTGREVRLALCTATELAEISASPGVQLLEDEAAIDAAVAALQGPPVVRVTNRWLLQGWLAQNAEAIQQRVPSNASEAGTLSTMLEMGAPGLRLEHRTVPTAAELMSACGPAAQ